MDFRARNDTYSFPTESFPKDSQDPPESESTEGYGLSTGAKAGIVVGTLAVVTVAITAVIFYYRRIYPRSKSSTRCDGKKPGIPRVPELASGPMSQATRPGARDDPHMPEMDSTSPGFVGATPAEKDGAQVSELDGTGSSPQSTSPNREAVGSGSGAEAEKLVARPAVDGIPAPGSADELDELLKLDRQLEDRRKTLEEIRQVQDQQTAIRDRIEELRLQRESSR